MTKIEIRQVGKADVIELQKISRQTFYETFAESNTEANMQKYLDESFTIEKLTTELSNQNSEFYFAVQSDVVIGYLKVNKGQAQTELKDQKAVEIERIYVLKDFHGKKVGQLLYDVAVQVAKKIKADYLWLGVWVKNVRAINFYRKNGFREFDRHIFKLGDDEQTDIMMKLKIN